MASSKSNSKPDSKPKSKSKKELDKDVMYAKLMPSFTRSYDDEPEEEVDFDYPEEPAPIPLEDNGLSQLRSKLFGSDIMKDLFPSGGEHPVQLINLMEKLVLERMDEAFSKFNCCRCDRCRMDVLAITLNKVHTKYVVGDQAEILRVEESITTKEISAALIQAILKVRANPRH